MLEACGLTLWRGPHCLFERLSFTVRGGTALVLRGPNGSGKTTLLRVLCGLTLPEEGTILWDGERQAGGLRGRVAWSGHQSGLNADLTVRQNLAFYARLAGRRGDWEPLLAALGIEDRADLEVRYLSAGQKRRAALARVLMSGAAAWLLDEPFTNLDADGRRLVEARIGAHLAAGGLAVLAAHDEIRPGDTRVATLTLGGGD